MSRLYKLAKSVGSWMSFLDTVKKFPNWYLVSPEEKRMTKKDLLEYFETVRGQQAVKPINEMTVPELEKFIRYFEIALSDGTEMTLKDWGQYFEARILLDKSEQEAYHVYGK